MSQSLIERTLRSFALALSRALLYEHTASLPGLLQQLDPRVRVVGVLILAVSVVLCRRIEVLAALFVLAILITLSSRVSLRSLAVRVWLVVLVFTGIIALPALFLTPGEAAFTIPFAHLSVTEQGMRTAVMLVLRVETAATLTTVLVLCTPSNQILKALGSLHLPAEVVTMLAMTHRYVFLLLETSNQMFESRQSRSIGKLSSAEQRKMTARTAGVLLSKSMELGQDVYLAMLSRGFRGQVQLLNDFSMRLQDYAALAFFVAAASLIVWIGR
jgi:cobalt/nickel transport system permease protein